MSATLTQDTGAREALHPSPGNPRFELFDGLRAVAALSVLLFHVGQQLGTPSTVVAQVLMHLNMGVVVFFLISGFLLYRPFVAGRHGLGPETTMRGFYRRRALRILPAYWLCLSVLLALAIAPRPHGHQWLTLYGLGQTWVTDAHGVGVSVAWSLSAEAGFYLLLPVYAVVMGWVARRSDRAVELLVLGLLSLASLAFHQQIAGDRALSVLGTFYLFALGMALAVLSVGRERNRADRRHGAGWARSAPLVWATAAGLFALICTRPEQSPVWPPYALVALLLVLPAVFSADRRDPVRDVLRDPRAMWLGLVSYGVYLWHRPLVEQLNARGLDGRHWSHFATGVTATIAGGIALGAASYYVVERPALRLKRSAPARRG